MSPHIATVTGILVSLLAVTRCDEAGNAEALRAVAEANNAFGTALYKTLSSEPGNLVMSPLSVQAVMAMAWLGAGGETATELAAGLRLPETRSTVEAGYKTLMTTLRSSPYVTLDIANKMYVQKGFEVKEAYRNTAVNNFRSDVEEVDFYNQTEEARTAINQWVEEKTHNKIKDLIEKGTLSEQALLIAVNAIYFKGGWRKPFEESETVSEPFHLTSSSSVNVSMMHLRGRVYYSDVHDLKSKALRLLYRGNQDDNWGQDQTQSMILILPNEVDGLAKLESNIANLNVTQLKQNMGYGDTIVAVPKFKVEKTIPLVEKLKQLGIRRVFGAGADLSGIAEAGIVINKVLQKAFVEVTEKGTEAAAATFFEAVPSSYVPYTPPEFKANHPFLFLIVDDSTDAILFMGRVADPS